jgi:hypothetical protein
MTRRADGPAPGRLIFGSETVTVTRTPRLRCRLHFYGSNDPLANSTTSDTGPHSAGRFTQTGRLGAIWGPGPVLTGRLARSARGIGRGRGVPVGRRPAGSLSLRVGLRSGARGSAYYGPDAVTFGPGRTARRRARRAPGAPSPTPSRSRGALASRGPGPAARRAVPVGFKQQAVRRAAPPAQAGTASRASSLGPGARDC